MKTHEFQQKMQNLSAHDFPVYLSERAHGMALRAAIAESEAMFLRVSIRGGGCAGLQYNLDIDDKESPFDVSCHMGDLKVVSDIFSLRYLKDTHVDYQESLEGAGFKFDNPNARRSCGCGSSFSA